MPFTDELVDIHYKVKVDGKERILDIVFKDAIVEVKYWNKDTCERALLKLEKGLNIPTKV
jgi:hypothetical protein